MPSQTKYKTLWPRFNAALIDSLVFMAITYGPRLIWDEWRVLFSDLMADTVFLVYTICMHSAFGQTLGKMLYKVKVVHVSEKREINFKQALIRDAVPLIIVLLAWVRMLFPFDDGTNLSYFIPTIFISSLNIGWLVLELITALFNKKSRAVHDLLARTVVIRTLKVEN